MKQGIEFAHHTGNRVQCGPPPHGDCLRIVLSGQVKKLPMRTYVAGEHIIT